MNLSPRNPNYFSYPIEFGLRGVCNSNSIAFKETGMLVRESSILLRRRELSRVFDFLTTVRRILFPWFKEVSEIRDLAITGQSEENRVI